MRHRYYVEHILLPFMFLGLWGRRVMLDIDGKKEGYLIDLYTERKKGRAMGCPYPAEKFAVTQVEEGQCRMVRIGLPEPEMETLCYRLYLCSDNRLRRRRYFTVEKVEGGGALLCEWRRAEHILYGFVPNLELEEVQMVLDLYNHLR